MSGHIGNLSFLRYLWLQENELRGTIPNQIGNLFRLRVLNISYNLIEGEIPLNLTSCLELKILDLKGNDLIGTIPLELGYLLKLEFLYLGRNRLSGLIPSTFANLSSLITINLGTNNLGGLIPSDLGRLQNLKQLDLTVNNLTGLVPSSLYNISSLIIFALAANQLRGQIPADVGDKLPNLLDFNLCFNRFTGPIPRSLHNITKIRIITIAYNHLVSSVPQGLESLPELRSYNIRFNLITSSDDHGLNFITSLTNSTHLKFLAIAGNLLEGVIPETIGNLSNDLTHLYMGGNHIYGSIPPSIGRLRGLALLNLSYNLISGEIPPEIGLLDELQVLNLAANKIFGRIPKSLGNLHKLNQFDISGNKLIGSIPTSFKFDRLISMDLSNNRLNGTIPKEILSLTSLSTVLNLSKNLLSGPLPQEIGMLRSVVTIDLSTNLLSGRIPISIGNCKSLEKLFMANNLFSGSIPDSIGELKGLETLDLSSNQLSGSIPNTLQNLHALRFLNLSFNQLKGKIPTGGIFRNLSSIYLEGNSGICSNLDCEESRGHESSTFPLYVIVIVVTFLIAICILIGLIFCLKREKEKIMPTSESVQMISYDKLRVATDNFNQNHRIGNGAFGSVYKGSLSDETCIAVKVLDLGRNESWNSFRAECEVLKNLRHRNIVKLITSCSSVDCKNSDFLALVYEFMSNGSLEDWIEGKRRHGNGESFGFMQRVNVAIDVANAMVYLHRECKVPVVHCDLKPSNVLLDEHMTAKIADFGLARMLDPRENDRDWIDSTIRGSIGYIPPEYGQSGKPSASGDVYSYGVVLLQLFTGKSPTCEEFTETSLIEWVRSNFPMNIVDLVDPELFPAMDDLSCEDKFIGQERLMQSFTTVIEVGMSCTANSPSNRIGMRDALHKLKSARDTLLKSELISRTEN